MNMKDAIAETIYKPDIIHALVSKVTRIVIKSKCRMIVDSL
jgi:hypothetical protein